MWYRVTNIDKANMWYNWKSKTTKGNITKMFDTKGFQGDKYFNLYILVPFFSFTMPWIIKNLTKKTQILLNYIFGDLCREHIVL